MSKSAGKPRFVISVLGKTHKRDSFTCGTEALDTYLQEHALQHMKKNISVTYALTECSGAEVLGYYSLSSTSIHLAELPPRFIKKLPKYPSLPGILLGRLAVHIELQGEGLGAHLLIDALKQSLRVSQEIGAAAVIVDAKNQDAVNFYKKYDFIALDENPQKLFLPMDTVKKLDL